MTNKELFEHIERFRWISDSQKLIIFVGAGVSRNAGLPSWNDLIKKMAKTVGYDKCESCNKRSSDCEHICEMINSFSTDEYLKIPQYLYNSNVELYNKIINDSIPQQQATAHLSNAIFDIAPVHIITTNYDKLLETCTNPLCETYDVIVHDSDLLQASKSHYIIKMHGDIACIDSIVLKEADYLEYSQKHVLIEMFVKALLADHTILFLGYSMNDYNIKLIISWINYMITQNHAIRDNRKIGYIVQDEESEKDMYRTYFENNNIGVINLHDMPVIKEASDVLTDPIGQRLYSFLKVINNPSLETCLGCEFVYDRAVDFMKQFRFVNIQSIASALHLDPSNIEYGELGIRSSEEYDSLVGYLQGDGENAKLLDQVLVDSGILRIRSWDPNNKKKYILKSENSLSRSDLFQMYLQNQYYELAIELQKREVSLQRCFYEHIISGYSKNLFDSFAEIQYDKLSDGDKVAYLFDNLSITWQKTYKFDKKKIVTFINNIPSKQVQSMYNTYFDIFNGNKMILDVMDKKLTTLEDEYSSKENILVGSWGVAFNEIKLRALEAYNFYFFNSLFFHRTAELKSVLNRYIRAMLITNKETEDKKFSYEPLITRDWSMPKYQLDDIDIDILTKFIAPKELWKILCGYDICELNISNEVIQEIVKQYENLIVSIISMNAFSPDGPMRIFLNYGALIPKCALTDDDKSRIGEALKSLFIDQRFIDAFFSANAHEPELELRIIRNLLDFIHFESSSDIVISIIGSKEFEKYVNAVDIGVLEKVILHFTTTISQKIQHEINDLLQTLSIRGRIKALRLLMRCISDDDFIATSKHFLRENYAEIDDFDKLDFICNEWVTLTEDDISKLMSDAISLLEFQNNRTPFGSNTLGIKLQLIYILFSMDKICNVSPLKEFANEQPILQFLLDSDSFDYSQADFSNVMWGNFVQNTRLREKILAHKESIIPNIERRIKRNTATEFERRLLYGCLLDRDSILHL